jgi:hypothetical protein
VPAPCAGKFALGGDDAAGDNDSGGSGGLTHGGIPLDQLEDLAALPGDALGDMDEGVLRDIMQEYNFGGGGEGGGGGAEGEGRKTRKQVRRGGAGVRVGGWMARV